LGLNIAKNTKAFHRLPNGTYGLLGWYPEVEKKQRERVRPASAESEEDEPPPVEVAEEEGEKGAA
jgi:hypothetical protein